MKNLVSMQKAAIQNRLAMLTEMVAAGQRIDISSATREADAIGNQLCRLSRFLVCNREGFRKICKKVRALV